MPIDCSPDLFGFAAVERRKIGARSMKGASCRVPERFSLMQPNRVIGSSSDWRPDVRNTRARELIEHAVATLVGRQTSVSRLAMKT